MRVHQAMTLDRRFQAVLLEYIGLFELQFRAQYSQELARVGGAFAHRDEENFKSPEHYREFVGDYQRELNRQLNAGNRHVMALMGRYGELPIWDAVEVMSFGTLSKMYKNTRSKAVRFVVADSFGVRHEMLESWMQSIAYARNRCAHFGRLLGTTLSAPPKRLRSRTSIPSTLFSCSRSSSTPMWGFLMTRRSCTRCLSCSTWRI